MNTEHSLYDISTTKSGSHTAASSCKQCAPARLAAHAYSAGAGVVSWVGLPHRIGTQGQFQKPFATSAGLSS